jgi:hypothetical protein
VRIRQQLRVLRIYAAINTAVIAVLGTAAFRQANAPQKLNYVTVHRIDVVDNDGTLRMVISNKDRMHPGVMDGKTIDRPRARSRGCSSSMTKETKSVASPTQGARRTARAAQTQD